MAAPYQQMMSIKVPDRLVAFEKREFDEHGESTAGVALFGEHAQFRVAASEIGRRVANRLREARSKRVRKVQLVMEFPISDFVKVEDDFKKEQKAEGRTKRRKRDEEES
jgi:hypothetical protein